MDNFVNKVAQLQRLVFPADIEVQADPENETLRFRSPLGSTCLRLIRLYRPSSHEVKQAGAKDVLLVLTSPSRKALEAATDTNYLVLPDGACRIIAGGIVLILEASSPPVRASQRVRLTGKTGVVAETLLLGGSRRWAVRELAQEAQVSPALTHRVLHRLEREGFLVSEGSGPRKVRAVRDLQALAELWSQEERKPQTVLRGFLYGLSLGAVAQQVLSVYPDGAIGALLAANLYKPILTRVPPPLRLWVKGDFDPTFLKSLGFERTEEGANLEFVMSKDDPWRVHRNSEEIPKVSKARAWIEISDRGGRTEELADALLQDLGEER